MPCSTVNLMRNFTELPESELNCHPLGNTGTRPQPPYCILNIISKCHKITILIGKSDFFFFPCFCGSNAKGCPHIRAKFGM